MSLEAILKESIREVQDFPQPGINFKDITPIMLNPSLAKRVVKELTDPWRDSHVTKVIGIESRGFLFGPQIAAELDAGFVLLRKAGKLPPETTSISYKLEYGEATIEMVKGAIQYGDRVLIHDDLLATGGTAGAAARLVQQLGAEVSGFSFLIELDFLHGRNTLMDFSGNSHSVVHY